MRKFGLRAFGLSLMAVLGLMAFSAVAAQAENLTDGGKPGLFVVLGSGPLIVGETATGAQVGSGLLLVAELGIDITCTDAEVLEGKFLSDTEALAKLLFLGCIVLKHGTKEEIKECVINNGLHITATAIILAKKHEGKPYVLAESDPSGGAFTKFRFEAEKGCALPLANEVTGTVGAALLEGEQVTQHITSSQAIQELLGDKLVYGSGGGNHQAFIDVLAEVHLTGAHLGCKFGVV